jgi:hypothetical protein
MVRPLLRLLVVLALLVPQALAAAPVAGDADSDAGREAALRAAYCAPQMRYAYSKLECQKVATAPQSDQAPALCAEIEARLLKINAAVKSQTSAKSDRGFLDDMMAATQKGRADNGACVARTMLPKFSRCSLTCILFTSDFQASRISTCHEQCDLPDVCDTIRERCGNGR